MRESLYTQVIIGSILSYYHIGTGYILYLSLKVIGWYTDSNNVKNKKTSKGIM